MFDLSELNDIVLCFNCFTGGKDSGFVEFEHGLRTTDEGINQRYLKNWADVADKICFGRT